MSSVRRDSSIEARMLQELCLPPGAMQTFYEDPRLRNLQPSSPYSTLIQPLIWRPEVHPLGPVPNYIPLQHQPTIASPIPRKPLTPPDTITYSPERTLKEPLKYPGKFTGVLSFGQNPPKVKYETVRQLDKVTASLDFAQTIPDIVNTDESDDEELANQDDEEEEVAPRPLPMALSMTMSQGFIYDVRARRDALTDEDVARILWLVKHWRTPVEFCGEWRTKGTCPRGFIECRFAHDCDWGETLESIKLRFIFGIPLTYPCGENYETVDTFPFSKDCDPSLDEKHRREKALENDMKLLNPGIVDDPVEVQDFRKTMEWTFKKAGFNDFIKNAQRLCVRCRGTLQPKLIFNNPLNENEAVTVVHSHKRRPWEYVRYPSLAAAMSIVGKEPKSIRSSPREIIGPNREVRFSNNRNGYEELIGQPWPHPPRPVKTCKCVPGRLLLTGKTHTHRSLLIMNTSSNPNSSSSTTPRTIFKSNLIEEVMEIPKESDEFGSGFKDDGFEQRSNSVKIIKARPRISPLDITSPGRRSRPASRAEEWRRPEAIYEGTKNLKRARRNSLSIDGAWR